jgi:hypothetical protein
MLLAGCGGPDELADEEARTLQSARERLDDAIDPRRSCTPTASRQVASPARFAGARRRRYASRTWCRAL